MYEQVLYRNREVADNVLPASAGSAVPGVWRSTSAPTPGRSPRHRLRLHAGRRCLPLLLRRLLHRRVCGSPSHAARPTVGPVVGAAALLVDSKSIAAKDGSLVLPIEHGFLISRRNDDFLPPLVVSMLSALQGDTCP